jgi:hypothetical protein
MRTSVAVRCAVTALALLGLPGVTSPAGAATTRTYVRVFHPHPTSTHGFTGYQTIRVRAPDGGSVVGGSARLVGGDRGAVVIRQAYVNPEHTRFVVRLEFPGEQGSPGQLRVRVVTVPPPTLTFTYRFQPNPTRTVGFNGYQKIVVRPRNGVRIISASARIEGGDPGAVVIRRTSYASRHRAYVVRLLFPGEQGRNGVLEVRLVTAG